MPSGSKSPTTETTHGGEAYWGPLSRPKTSACHGPSGGPAQPPLASALSARVVVQSLVAHQCVRWGLHEHHRDMAHLCLHQNGRKQRRTEAGGGVSMKRQKLASVRRAFAADGGLRRSTEAWHPSTPGGAHEEGERVIETKKKEGLHSAWLSLEWEKQWQ
jgi:hypothetical protein